MSERIVSRQDELFFDQHVFDYSDEYRFVGYESKPKQLLERFKTAEESIRGLSVYDVQRDVARQMSLVNMKKEALFNVLSQNDDAKYHIDNQVVTSFVGKMMDDYAVADVISNEATSMEYDFQGLYYNAGDPALTYTTHNFKGQDINDRNILSHSFERDMSLDEVRQSVEESFPDIDGDNVEVIDSNEFAYLESQPYHAEQTRRAYFRGAYVGQVVDPTDGTKHTDKTSFTSMNEIEGFERDGVYKIEDGELYKYDMSETYAQKMSGTDSVWEAERLTLKSGYLNGSRERFLDQFKTELENETGRLNDFDFSGLESSLNEQVVVPKPQRIRTKPELENEDEIEL